MPVTQEQMDAWKSWRDRERQKDRIMTIGEYTAWLRGGDALSGPHCTRNGWRNLTVILGPPVIGTVIGGELPPTF